MPRPRASVGGWYRPERGLVATGRQIFVTAAARRRALPPSHLAISDSRHATQRSLILMLFGKVVAALHDTSVEMIERHYSRWITEGLDEFAARAIVPLVAA